MEKLKEFDVKELLRRQAMLDEKFNKKETVRKRTIERIVVALITEIGELCQTLKNDWNYWKNSTKKTKKTEVLEELSDVLHFFLSFLNFRNGETNGDVICWLRESLISDFKNQFSEKDLEGVLISLSNFRIFDENKTLATILVLAERIATIEEFLEIHHKKFLKNLNERTKEVY